MHLVTVLFHLMSAKYRQQPRVILDQRLHGLSAKEVSTFSLTIFLPVTFSPLFVVHWVGPEQVAEETGEGDFYVAIYLLDLLDFLELGGNTTVDCEVFLADVC